MRTWTRTLAGATLLLFGSATVQAGASDDPAAVVRGFMDEVRSGRDPDAAARYFAPRVAAHQMVAEGGVTVYRTPADYAAHVREFLTLFGRFDFKVEELVAQGDRVYVRWRQRGHHIGSHGGEAPTGAPLVEVSSAVYRVERGRIVEYWIQTDRKGLEIQLERARGKSR
jgi:predicted ester cyclase